MSGKVKKVTDISFNREVLEADRLVLVDFWANWCGPCRALGPVLDDLAVAMENERFYIRKLNIDDNNITAAEYKIRTIPTMLFFKKGEVVEKIVGPKTKEQLIKIAKKHIY